VGSATLDQGYYQSAFQAEYLGHTGALLGSAGMPALWAALIHYGGRFAPCRLSLNSVR